MSTIKISELATSAISLSDFFAKADASGLANKNTMQGLSNFLNTVGTLAYRGVLLAADAAVTLDGIYVAGDDGTYTNNGGLVITLSNQIVLISITETQTVFEKVEIPVSLVIDSTPTYNSLNAVESGGVSSEFNTLISTVNKFNKNDNTFNDPIPYPSDPTYRISNLIRVSETDVVRRSFDDIKSWQFRDINGNLISSETGSFSIVIC